MISKKYFSEEPTSKFFWFHCASCYFSLPERFSYLMSFTDRQNSVQSTYIDDIRVECYFRITVYFLALVFPFSEKCKFNKSKSIKYNRLNTISNKSIEPTYLNYYLSYDVCACFRPSVRLSVCPSV